MINDNLKNTKQYRGQYPNLDIVFDYIETHDLTSLPLGKTIIDDQNYVMIFENILVEGKIQPFEAHHVYGDLHMTLNDKELIHYTSEKSLTITREYLASEEAALGIADKYESCEIDPTHFAVFFPGEAHSVKNHAGFDKVKKAVFKFKQ